VLVEVRDTGAGLDPDFTSEMFKPFRQADSSSTRHFQGLGLGLAIVKRIVELHGGTVKATSPGLGLGTTMTVELPEAEPEVEPEPELVDARGAPRQGSRKTGPA
jgi:signal transduction histidine kinase